MGLSAVGPSEVELCLGTGPLPPTKLLRELKASSGFCFRPESCGSSSSGDGCLKRLHTEMFLTSLRWKSASSVAEVAGLMHRFAGLCFVRASFLHEKEGDENTSPPERPAG